METTNATAPYSMPPRHIVCATDLSPGSRSAEISALRLARTFGASLTFAWVDPAFIYHAELLASSGGLASPAFDPAKREAYLLQRSRELRAHVAPLAASAGGVPFEVMTDSGDPALSLLAWMQAKGTKAVDLLVLGHKHRSAIAGFFMGSTATTLLEQVRCPALVVPDRVPEARLTFQNLALATDLTHTSDAPARAAWAFASAHKGRVMLVHAFDAQDFRAVPPDTFASEGAYRELADLFARASEIKTAHLKREAEKMSSWGSAGEKVECSTRLVEGSPKEALLQYVHDAQPNLLVAGRWSQAGGLATFLLGSTARALAIHADTPVLVVPHDK